MWPYFWRDAGLILRRFGLDNIPVFLPNAGKSTGLFHALRDSVPGNSLQDP